jgi:lipopolysaccharide transport system ATP-binding protein
MRIIQVEGVSKLYHIGVRRERYVSLRDELVRWIKQVGQRLRGGPEGATARSQFWALKEVNVAIEAGEAVGVIGRNGAGKSTLLKILSRITPPTEGRIVMRGRVGSLLEVGTGFHPELTGRENIFLNGAVLGMSRAEVRRKFDEIVEFAEMGDFLETPVKRYSSGMYVRLAFAVAAHLEPEILLLDEVLAVGDAAFQQKCLSKMGDVARGGSTVLFVSHNMGAIRAFCGRCIVVDKGHVIFDGPTEEAVTRYLGVTSANVRACVKYHDARSDKPAFIRAVSVTNEAGLNTGILDMSAPLTVTIKYFVREWPKNAYVTFDLFDAAGNQLVWSCDAAGLNTTFGQRRPQGENESTAVLPGHVLKAGFYRVGTGIYSPTDGVIDVRDDALTFEIVDDGSFLARLGITRSPALTGIATQWLTKAGS